MHAEEQYALRAFKAGANGYVTKDSAAEELMRAVRKVPRGGAYVTASLAERVVQQLNGARRACRATPQLSDRELEVLRRIVAGQRMTDIAEALHLSVKTISTHKTRIQDKLQLPSTAALIRYGLEQPGRRRQRGTIAARPREAELAVQPPVRRSAGRDPPPPARPAPRRRRPGGSRA